MECDLFSELLGTIVGFLDTRTTALAALTCKPACTFVWSYVRSLIFTPENSKQLFKVLGCVEAPKLVSARLELCLFPVEGAAPRFLRQLKSFVWILPYELPGCDIFDENNAEFEPFVRKVAECVGELNWDILEWLQITPEYWRSPLCRLDSFFERLLEQLLYGIVWPNLRMVSLSSFTSLEFAVKLAKVPDVIWNQTLPNVEQVACGDFLISRNLETRRLEAYCPFVM